MGGASALENIRSICAIFMAADLTFQCIDYLIVIITRKLCSPEHDLSTPVPIANFGGAL